MINTSHGTPAKVLPYLRYIRAGILFTTYKSITRPWHQPNLGQAIVELHKVTVEAFSQSKGTHANFCLLLYSQVIQPLRKPAKKSWENWAGSPPPHIFLTKDNWSRSLSTATISFSSTQGKVCCVKAAHYGHLNLSSIPGSNSFQTECREES